MLQQFHDRNEAGIQLSQLLQTYKQQDNVIVLALPRGGLPVAAEIAKQLHCPLDLLLVRKLGAPSFPELAMGAIASGGVKILNQAVVNMYGISENEINQVEITEKAELQRRELAYRGDHPFPDLTDKVIIVVDDGIATGATMKAALQSIRMQHPKKIVLAVPVAPIDTVEQFNELADEVICPLKPYEFNAVGQWYRQFEQVSDQSVKEILQQAWQQ